MRLFQHFAPPAFIRGEQVTQSAREGVSYVPLLRSAGAHSPNHGRRQTFNAMTMKGLKTEYVHPPIPVRHWDWKAWKDGEEDVLGWGMTREAAIADLMEVLASIDDPAVKAAARIFGAKVKKD